MTIDATTPPSIGEHFGRFARTYDAGRRKLIPEYETFYRTAVDVVGLREPSRRVGRVLDLGAGTGLLSALVADAVPDSTMVLVDASADMLALAPERLGDAWSRCEAIVADFSEALPAGPFDAVVSALAIHHLAHVQKQALFARVHDALVPGGVFVNAEQVAGPTDALDAHYRSVWDTQTRASGATDHELAEAAVRMAVDQCASVETQCEWLRDARFVDVDCFFKSWRFAVYGGWRSA
jgi:tRNA (cmo5U34)-methyltransferase